LARILDLIPTTVKVISAMLISLSAVPLALALRKVKLGGRVHMGH
jgi:hypothetical protein